MYEKIINDLFDKDEWLSVPHVEGANTDAITFTLDKASQLFKPDNEYAKAIASKNQAWFYNEGIVDGFFAGVKVGKVTGFVAGLLAGAALAVGTAVVCKMLNNNENK